MAAWVGRIWAAVLEAVSSGCDQVWSPIMSPARITARAVAASGPTCRPISKKVACTP
jgi:hypothetical protein